MARSWTCILVTQSPALVALTFLSIPSAQYHIALIIQRSFIQNRFCGSCCGGSREDRFPQTDHNILHLQQLPKSALKVYFLTTNRSSGSTSLAFVDDRLAVSSGEDFHLYHLWSF
ncbi:hypothetical protein I312_106061 [Cryptococcus bacillisporus CA1280]|uniref:uncharacterized protein n=1 Tax=Cryptococcus bacillisporus CA1280 TaxID=1296109 RepID=UPI003369649F